MLKSLKDPKALKISKEEAYLIIHEFLNREIELARREMMSKETFSSPAWSEHQAYQLGILKCLDKIQSFIPEQGK